MQRIYRIEIKIDKGSFMIFGGFETLVNAIEESFKTGLFMVGSVTVQPSKEEIQAMQEAQEAMEMQDPNEVIVDEVEEHEQGE